jgi:hypothetical protein
MSEEVEDLLYGGAKSGGKSVMLCIFAYNYAKMIIDMGDLKPTKYPLPVGFLGRKQSTDFMDTTLESWKKIIPQDCYEIRVQDKEIVIDNTVKIQYGGLDDTDTVKKFNSAEYFFACIDQAEEVSRDDVGMIKGTFRSKLNGLAIPFKLLLTANPADCWLMDDFITKKLKGKSFVQALPSDNTFIDNEKYVERLKETWKHRPELIDAYVYGKWEQLKGFVFIVTRKMMTDAFRVKAQVLSRHKIIVAVDPARFGDDETVIYVVKDNMKIYERILFNKSTMDTAGHVCQIAEKYNAGLIVIDTIGVGGGVYDRVQELSDIRVVSCNSSEKATENNTNKYLNLRAEMWDNVAQMLTNQVVPICELDEELTRELTSVKYEFKNGKMKVEGKDEIKKRLGKSPGRADAFVMALQYIKNTPYVDDDDNDGYFINLAGTQKNAVVGY